MSASSTQFTFRLRDPHPNRVQRIMRAASRAESVAETQKVLFVNLVEYPHHRLLNYLVLQRGYSDRPLSTVRFGQPGSLRGLYPVSATLDSLMETR